MIVDVVFVVSGSSPEFNHNWQEQSSCGIFDMEVIVMSVRALSRPRPGPTDGLTNSDINIAQDRNSNNSTFHQTELHEVKILARLTLKTMSTIVFIAHLLLLIIDTLRHNIFNLLHE